MVLDLTAMGLPANSPVLWTSLACYPSDLLYIHSCRGVYLQAAQATP